MWRLIGFDLEDYSTEKLMTAFIEGDLKYSLISVSEVYANKKMAIRRVEAVVRQCLKLAVLEGWKDSNRRLAKMLTVVETIKQEVANEVNGWKW